MGENACRRASPARNSSRKNSEGLVFPLNSLNLFSRLIQIYGVGVFVLSSIWIIRAFWTAEFGLAILLGLLMGAVELFSFEFDNISLALVGMLIGRGLNLLASSETISHLPPQ